MHRIYVSYIIPDAREKLKKKQFNALGLKNKLGAVYLADCYTIDTKLDKQQLEKTKRLLANPLSEKADVNTPQVNKFSYAVQIGFLPGVTDNIGNTAKETLQDGARVKFKPGQNVYSSQVLFISGAISSADLNKIISSLHNPLIQSATITPYSEFQKNGLPLILPKVKIKSSNKILKVNLNVSDDELVKLGKLGILDSVIPEVLSASEKLSGIQKNRFPTKSRTTQTRRGPLALSLDELKAIRDYFNSLRRNPTDIELETLAQTWSEHCKHTIFGDPMDELKNGIYKTYIKSATEAVRKQKASKAKSRNSSGGDFCVSVFTDNAGGISFDKDWIISHKVETHNTPSALDPFGGSITGIVGVNRDTVGFGLGAKPVANFYGFCLADPNDKSKLFRDKELKNPMLSARRIMDGVVSGINAGGNQSGIPTPLGFLYFNEKFRGKPLVFAGTLGMTPKKIGKRLGHEKCAKPGDYIVTVGGRIGADGIHGATFSSEGLDSHSPATAVQIGDPITQKKFSDAIIKEARELNLYNSITDCGAGGLSSAVGEMASQAGGCIVNLEKAPLKYPGLSPWQIWISESQERMALAVPKNKWLKLKNLLRARGVEATIIGEFTNSKKCQIKYQNKLILDMEMDFLHNGRPKQHLKTKKPESSVTPELKITEKKNYSEDVLNLLKRPNICSTEFISTQYDHEVQGSSVIKPLQGAGRVNNEASVFRPLLNSPKGAVVSYGLNPALSEISPYDMASNTIDSAIRSAVATGANVDYLALLDNFCWCSPDEPKRLWQLKEAARACFDTAVDFGTPFISGKDSMHNDFKGFNSTGQQIKISIPPTLLITTAGVIPDATKSVSLDAKISGDLIYILGDTNNEMAGSEYLQMLKQQGGNVPKVDAHKNYLIYKTFFEAVQKNIIASAISVNYGGLATALSKTLIGGNLGAEINLANLPGNWQKNYEALFSQSAGRILVTVDAKKSQQFENLFFRHSFAKIGKIISKPQLTILDKSNKKIVDLKLAQALKSYKLPFKDF